MQSSRLLTAALGGIFAAGLLGGVQAPAKADTASTAAIIAGAAAIGVLLYDSNNRPYYQRGGHTYYVTHDQAMYYRQHHPNYRAPQHRVAPQMNRMHGGQMHGGQMHGGQMHGGQMHGGEMHGGEMHGGDHG